MSPTLEVHPLATREARTAREWYEARSDTAGEEFIEELNRTIQKILSDPLRWPEYMFGARRVMMKRFPYLVIYRATAQSVKIIAVAHGRRRPGYWKSR